MNYELILFDLGNVVFHIHPERTFDVWARYCELDPSELRKLSCSHTQNNYTLKFGIGALRPQEFYRQSLEHFDIDISMEQFTEGWNALFGELIDETANALERISDKAKLAALTDTNAIHAEAFQKLYPKTLSYFEKIFTSHELGARKSSPQAFESVLSYFGKTPEQTIFLDDSPSNIATAQSLGITSLLFDSPKVIGSKLMPLLES